MSRIWNEELAAEGVRVLSLDPGDMDTPMLQRSFQRAPDPAAMRRELEAAYPLKRIADPAEIANAVVFLLSDESSFVTGSLLVADGGLTAKCY